MLCQNCHLNESTIHLYTNVSGQQRQIDLCQNCYQIMKTDPNNAILGGLGGNSQPTSNATNQSTNPFDDFFSNLGGFPAFGGQGFQNTLQHNLVEEIMDVAATEMVTSVKALKLNNKSQKAC